MPKHDNINGRTSNGQQPRSSSRRQQPNKGDERRENLLEKILEESSSISLNDPSSQINAKQVLDNHSRLFELIAELRDVESGLNPRLPQRDESSWTRFIEWIDTEVSRCTDSSNHGPSQSAAASKTTIKQVDDAGRLFARVGIKTSQQLQSSMGSAASNADGAESESSAKSECSLVAKVPFKKGDEVFRIPRRVMLTTETAIQDLDLLDFVKKDSIASGMQNVVLVLHLLNEFSKREQSYWWPYLAILPNKLLPILRMNKSSFTSYLACSAHLNEALKMLRAIVRQYCYFYKRLQSTKLPLRKDITLEYYSWGVSMVCSRNNEVPSKNRKHRHGGTDHDDERHEDYEKATCLSSSSIQALVPILDMCNHDSRSQQAVFDNDASCLVVCHDLLPNQEVTINYGNRSSGEFFIHNGFVPQEALAHDVLPLTVSLKHKQDFQLPLRAKLLKILNMPTTFGHFKLSLNTYENRHKRDPHLTMFLIVYSLTSDELEFILDAENPVGVADEIYEFVQYKSGNEINDEQTREDGSKEASGNDETEFVDKMKRRLDESLKEYLSRRASISIALIDRTLNELLGKQQDEGAKGDEKQHEEKASNDHDKLYLIRLLQHERRIHESYVAKADIKCC